MPSLVGIVDEDSSSNSMPAKVDALLNGGSNDSGAIKTEPKDVPDAEPVKNESSLNIKIKLKTSNGESSAAELKTEPVKSEEIHTNEQNTAAQTQVEKIFNLLIFQEFFNSF